MSFAQASRTVALREPLSPIACKPARRRRRVETLPIRALLRSLAGPEEVREVRRPWPQLSAPRRFTSAQARARATDQDTRFDRSCGHGRSSSRHGRRRSWPPTSRLHTERSAAKKPIISRSRSAIGALLHQKRGRPIMGLGLRGISRFRWVLQPAPSEENRMATLQLHHLGGPRSSTRSARASPDRPLDISCARWLRGVRTEWR